MVAVPAGLAVGRSSAVAARTVVVLQTGERDDVVAAVARRVAERSGAEVVTTPYPARAAAVPGALVCMGAGRRGLRLLPGGRNPVLVIGPRCGPDPPLYGDVLVCLDGSRRAEAVLPTAASWSGALGLGLLLTSVVAPSRPADLASPTYCPDVLENGYLGRVAAAGRGHGVAVNWEVLHGDRGAAVVGHVEHTGCAAVALNTHGASTGPQAPLGRLPARMVLSSPVPVLLTRHLAALPPPARPPRPPSRRPAAPVPPSPTWRPATLTSAARTYQAVANPRAGPGDEPLLPVPWRRVATWLTPLAAVVVALLAVFLHLPYYSLTGRTLPAAELLSISPGEHGGRILIPVVDTRSLTTVGALRAWFDPAAEVREREPRGTGWTWRQNVNRRLMATSRETAVQVATARLGRPATGLQMGGDPGPIGGPSGGLGFALHVLDTLSPGDLTGGKAVAVTGALDLRGRVYAVSGVRHKALAARRAHVDLFLVPRANYAEAVAAAPGLRVVAVSSLDEAVAALA